MTSPDIVHLVWKGDRYEGGDNLVGLYRDRERAYEVAVSLLDDRMIPADDDCWEDGSLFVSITAEEIQ